jgi:hypothetical protein
MFIKKNMKHAGTYTHTHTHTHTHTLNKNVNINMALTQKWNKDTKNNVRFYNANECILILLA